MSERVSELLEMTDTEILDWMSEYCDTAQPLKTPGPNRWSVLVDNILWLNGATIREAVRRAASYQKVVNRDF